MKKSNEVELIANAAAALADGEEVLAAGEFGCQDLMMPQVAGQAAGAMIGQDLGGIGGTAAGVLLGGLAAKKAAAEKKGQTMKLLVAVTPTKIHILNWGDGDAEERHHIQFERANADVTIKKFGLSRIITITDQASGSSFRLSGATAKMFSQSGPDKAVIDALTAA